MEGIENLCFSTVWVGALLENYGSHFLIGSDMLSSRSNMPNLTGNKMATFGYSESA